MVPDRVKLTVLGVWFGVIPLTTVTGLRLITSLDILSALLNQSTYDSSLPPSFNTDIPTMVVVQLSIFNIYSVSETEMEYSIDCVLRQTWRDDRLNFAKLNTTQDKLEVDDRAVDRIWEPGLYFVNEKRATLHTITSKNRAIFLYRNGTVLYSMRIQLTLQCSMLLQYFPFDSQTCPITIQSYAYDTDDIDIDWRAHDAVQIGQIEMPQFTLCGEASLSDYTEDYITGQFATLKATIQLERKTGYYLLQVIVPSIILVILSWVSFWIDPKAVPARVSLSVTCILTMTTQSSGIRQTLPPVSYVKAIDVWMIVCLLFVFAALLEFAYVNVLVRRQEANEREDNVRNQGVQNPAAIHDDEDDGDNEEQGDGVNIHVANARFVQFFNNLKLILPTEVDRTSRILFPLTFAVFTVVFHCVCLSAG